MERRIYPFWEGDGTNKDLLGGKGAGLCTMTQLGLPVPPGFVITTQVCREYYQLGGKLPPGLMQEVNHYIAELESRLGRRFGDSQNPLLVSVRSGAKYSMPGMMDTILNLGLNDASLEGLAKLTGNPQFAYDAYRRFLQMFGKIVLKIEGSKFESILDRYRSKAGVKHESELDAEALSQICREFKQLIRSETGSDIPADPYLQLQLAIEAVFRSWENPRAKEYRNFYGIPHDLGTAVNVQAMVFGNLGRNSGTGVMFTRNPATGQNEIYGEYLFNAQGEDVVSGARTPLSISQLEQFQPELYSQLEQAALKLEQHYRDMQDVEFTVESGKLYILQTRAGKRTPQAAVKIAVDMANQGLISKQEAVLRIEPEQIQQLLHPRVDPSAKLQVIAKGLNASPGAAVGQVVLDSGRAKQLAEAGQKVILVRPETNPDDVGGIIASQGVLTARGGYTSHAAVVTRGLGKPAVVGCEAIQVDEHQRCFKVGDLVIKEGDYITIDGSTGEVILGQAPLIPPQLTPELKTLLDWADQFSKLQVWANADYPRDAAKAREFGAKGIGLCRTEHMFFEPDRLPIFREAILAKDEIARRAALEKLIQIQAQDFYGILKIMDGLPVVIRLLDPPLHEFLPRYEELLSQVLELKFSGKDPQRLAQLELLLARVEQMREANPMMGFRGCRLGIVHPEIYEAQMRAIFQAGCKLKQEGFDPKLKIMIPLICDYNELSFLAQRLKSVAEQVISEFGVELDYKFGTMIEVPRAALTADRIGRYADFFSFGTNDLTQMVYGFSRDDAERGFLFQYLKDQVLDFNPFQRLDEAGVGKLMELGVQLGRAANPKLEVGICGEHGGDPASIEFCHKIGLDYVSCSPFRIPVARLAAAQAALKQAGIQRVELR